MRVLLAIITTPSAGCSLGFAVSMLRLQMALVTAPNMQAVVHVAPSIREAIGAAVDDGAFDAVVAVSASLGFPTSFVLRGLVASSPFVAGIYPLPVIDWDRVVSRATDTAEKTRFKGNTYNIDAAAAKPAPSAPGYLAVTRAGLGAVVLKKEAFDALAQADAKTDDDLCEAWGKDIVVDLDSQCTNMGPMDFTGCVGYRTVLR